MDNQFCLGPPSSRDDAFYDCEWCCAGFSGPAVKKPRCPRCGREGPGVYRVQQEWVERRFDEEQAIKEELGRAASIGVQYEGSARAEVIRKIREPFRKDDPMAKPAEATAEEKPKRAPKVKEKKPCACGCGGETGGTWVPGHDAKFYSAVRKVKAGEMTAKELEAAFPAETIKEYASRAH